MHYTETVIMFMTTNIREGGDFCNAKIKQKKQGKCLSG